MRVRVDGEHVHVERKAKIIRYGEIAGSGGNVELAVALELDEEREAIGRLVGEVETDGRLHLHRHSHRHHVGVENEIGAGIEFPREAVRLDPWHAAGLPEQEVTVEIENAVLHAQIHAGKTG